MGSEEEARPLPCCDDRDCNRGTPKPGKDTCSADVHGHVYYDGQCDNCLELDIYDSRERYDHVDACAFWRKKECDCTLDANGTMYVECPACKGRKYCSDDKCACPEVV